MSLAEHVYVGASEPMNPVIGAVWIDSANEKLFRCSATGPDVWTEVSVGGGGGGDLGDLSDVTITAISSGEVLKWDGAAWINQTLAETGIAPASHTHLEADVTDLGSYSVVGHTHVEGDITDLAHVITVRKNTGADVGTRARLNFIEGANIVLTIADDAGSGEVDVTIAATGGGGGGANVKGGRETAITEGGSVRTVTFGTAFVGTPNVVVTIADTSSRAPGVVARNISTTAFDIFVHKIDGGAAAARDVEWIATDAGDP